MIDTTGDHRIFDRCLGLIHREGRITMQGYYPDPISIDFHPTHLQRPTVIFPCGWDDEFNDELADDMATGRIAIDPLITHRIRSGTPRRRTSWWSSTPSVRSAWCWNGARPRRSKPGASEPEEPSLDPEGGPERMERGVYFDGWFPRQHCYHPSLPPRRLKMIEDLEAYHATSLVWASLGGGSISLPYLEQEAWGEVDERFRFYGFMNDAEFIEACQERGIKVFGCVFEVQGWEFPVELNEDESKVLSMNELRGVGKRGWLGLREFTQNTYPKIWKPLEDYFPDGLVNSDGEKVTDILEECTSRDIYGEACHSTWVEVPGNEHYAYLMDRNNPVWREYLKAIIRIQIDAGRRRRPPRRGGPADLRDRLRRLLLQGLHEAVPRLAAGAAARDGCPRP